jgi:hypothetical protein
MMKDEARSRFRAQDKIRDNFRAKGPVVAPLSLAFSPKEGIA